MVRYEFRQQDAYDIARHIGIETKQKGEELQFRYCPYCRGGKSGKDSGTFSINLATGQYKCLRASCGVSGNLLTLAKDFNYSLGNEYDTGNSSVRYRRLKQPEKKVVPKPPALEYLKGRGISTGVAERYQITVQSSAKNILVFPFLDENGTLQFVKYRKTDFDRDKDKNKEWCESGCKPILFGMYQCDPGNKTLVLTEGQIDSLSVAEAGIENADRKSVV